MEISVILPVYNAEKYVAAAIESILNQTFTNFELLLINDASTDSSAAILESYAARDARIRLIHNSENLGLTATLNKAIDLCQGEYIARMDADDISLPHRLATQVNFLEKHPEIGFCSCWVAIIDSQGELTGEQWVMRLGSPQIYARMYFHNCFVHTGIMMRRRYALLKYDAAQYPIQEDYEFWMRLIKVTQAALIPEILVYYRVHQQSITSSKNSQAKRYTRQIVSNQLQTLGLHPSESELDLHLAIGDQIISPDSAFIVAAHDWLLKLWQAFTRHHINRPDLQQSMNQLLSRFWLSILTQEGIAAGIARAYSHARLSKQLLSPTQRWKIWMKHLF
ncbi:MAG: glycosyltransferase family 2 protein [Cytophagales bacterium]|nr:glycosyltransferase [Bernardetiaceae bacterium]MDW8204048.1 glycosyltransferase family 2 protein [Cytophagales bacterium]